MLVWVSSIMDQDILRVVQTTSPTSTSTWCHWIQTERRGDCGYLVQYDQAYSGWVGLVRLGWLPILERGTPIINPQAGRLVSLGWQKTLVMETLISNLLREDVAGTVSACYVTTAECCYILSRGAKLWLS